MHQMEIFVLAKEINAKISGVKNVELRYLKVVTFSSDATKIPF